MFDLDLDKTYTIRQIFWRIVLFLISILVLYFCLLVRRDWNVTMGGVGYSNSPYIAMVPKNCLNVGGHRGHGSDNPIARIGFRAFQPRTFLWEISSYVEQVDCSNYRLLTGLHGDYWASYRIIFTKINDEPLVIETIEYHTTQQQSSYFTRKR